MHLPSIGEWISLRLPPDSKSRMPALHRVPLRLDGHRHLDDNFSRHIHQIQDPQTALNFFDAVRKTRAACGNELLMEEMYPVASVSGIDLPIF